MTEPPRPPLTRDTLVGLATAAGLDLTADELAGLLPPAAAIFAAVDRLDRLDLSATEPAAVCYLRPE